MLDSVPGPSRHNSMDRKNYCKVFCPICNRKFPVSAINEYADACLDKQTTPTTICITTEDEGNNLEENGSQTINHNSLSRNDIAAIISSAVNNNCRVINDFSIKLNIRWGFYFEDFVKAFNKKWNIGKGNHEYLISFVGELGIDTGGVSREFYSGIFS